MILAPGDRKMTTITAVLPFTRALGAHIFHGILDLAQVGQPDRRPVAESHDQIAVLVGLEQLIVGPDLPGFGPIRQLPFGAVDVGVAQKAAYILEADAVFVHRRRVQLNPDRGQRTAAHENRAYALHLGDFLLENGGGRIINDRSGDRVGGEGQDENGGIGGIDLAVGGAVGQSSTGR